jgi:predicted Rossmann fold flavoprotein
MRVAVIGGGAAGFFAAISVKAHHPGAEVTLFERSNKFLSKVRVSGGGRCNVCHDRREIAGLAKNYPRGERFLKRSFTQFSTNDTIRWFAERGVQLKTEADGRMFPTTDDSATIVDALHDEALRLGVLLKRGAMVQGIAAEAGPRFKLALLGEKEVAFDRVIVTTGGSPKPAGYDWLASLGHTIVPPVPSLFTFNMPGETIRELMGVSVDPSLESTGPLLITHWGMSGPAVLRLSAWGARELHDNDHRFVLRVNWLGGIAESDLRAQWMDGRDQIARKLAINANPMGLPKRLWAFLLDKAEVESERPWGELPKKQLNRLADVLTNDRYAVEGKTTFKEEFVTAGGVALEEVDPLTLCSKLVQGLYFAGEVLDIDGITGGFNFQAAWTTGFIAGRLGS